jgi:hypothetical protein
VKQWLAVLTAARTQVQNLATLRVFHLHLSIVPHDTLTFKERWSLHIPPVLTSRNSAFSLQSATGAWVDYFRNSINQMVFVTEAQCVSCDAAIHVVNMSSFLLISGLNG